ncbi:MAG: Hsp70 family protein [Myxococcales bacterium]|nr:Hsp70 family protein [Myxococcales bacterium]
MTASRPFKPEIYAIDFGTTNSLLAAANAGETHPPIDLETAAPESDRSILRSLLYFPDAGRCYYGREAIEQYTAHEMEGWLIRSVKKFLPNRAFVGTFIGERPMNLENLIATFLRELRRRANAYFDADIKRVLLGRPARFSEDDADDQFAQYRLERAARLAGFGEVHFCPEPIAAARDFRSTLREPRRVLVADFGGGTSDFTVLSMRAEGYDASDVLAIGGLSVAGDAFDASIMRHHVARHFGADVTYRVPLGNNIMRMPPALMEMICSPADATLLRAHDARRFLRDVQAWSLGPDDRKAIEQLFTFVEDRLGFRVFEAIEAAKRELSEREQAEVRFRYPGVELEEALGRPAFERSSRQQTTRIVACLDETLARAGIEPAAIDIVCCTGGTAKVPAVAAALAERFGQGKLTRYRRFHSVIEGLSDHARGLC